MKDLKNTDGWNAKYYKKHSDPRQFQRGLMAVQKMNLYGDEHVLDIGCGDGRLTAEIAHRLPNGSVHGIDISASMINEAKSCFGEIKNLSFQQADIVTWSSEKKCNVVVSFATFHWIKDQLQALQNIHHVLTAGGSLIIIMDAGGSRSINDVLTSEKWKPLIPPRNETYFPQSANAMTTMLKKCGFAAISTRIENNVRVFANADEFFNWTMNWLPQTTGLSREKVAELAQDIVDAVCADQKNMQQLEVEAPTLYVQATRS